MARARIAYAAEESVLLTIDGEMLLAYDAATGDAKWQLRFERSLAGVVFASSHALPRESGGNPWRTASSGTAAIAVDRGGGVHVVDANVGRVLGTIEELGAPAAIAASDDAFAIALSDRVLVWRDGIRHDIPHRATAIAFARDGSALALGNARGELRIVPLATFAVGRPIQLDGFVTDVAPRRLDEWVVATDEGIQHLEGKGATSARRISSGHAHAVLCDRSGNVLAVRRSDVSITVCEWPTDAVTRITLVGRRIEDIAFAGSEKLGIAVEGGDANVVDLATMHAATTHAQPGRPWRGWACHVESEQDHSARHGGSSSASASRLGVGALFTLIVLVVCVGYLSSSTHQSWVPPPPFLRIDPCNLTCERERLATLAQMCADRPELACAADAEAAQAAFELDACSDTRASLGRVELALRARDGGTDALVSTQRSLAEVGLGTACNPFNLPETRRAEIVRLAGPTLVAETDASPLIGDDPRALWIAPDGDVFLATVVRGGRCAIRRKTAASGWRGSVEALDCRATALFGRGEGEVYAALGSSVRRFDGKSWVDLVFPGSEIRTITGPPAKGGDVYVADTQGLLRRYHGGEWLSEPLPDDTSAITVVSGGSFVWAQGVTGRDRDTKPVDVLLRREKNAHWTMLPQASDSGSFSTPRGEMWVAPDGRVFAGYATVVTQSHDNGVTWTEEAVPAFVEHVWGRSSADVYAGGPSGLLHFDGAAWTHAAFSERVRALAGNATDVYIIADKVADKR